jgi:NAD(P)H-dependent FMN reductase
MRVEIISGSARINSQTKRVALHLHQKLQGANEVNVGLINLNEFRLGPVENVFNSACEAPLALRPIVERVLNADALILVSPEYNGSYSPAMKNFLDHFPKQTQKTLGIVTASPGAFGGMRAAMQLQSLTYGLMGIGSPQMLIVPELQKKFDENGQLIDFTFAESVDSFIESFLWLGHAVAYARTASVVKKCA